MRTTFAIATVLVVSACGSGNQPAPATNSVAMVAEESARLTSYLDAEFEKELTMSPEDLTSRGRKEQYDKLDDYSDAGEDRLLEWRRKSVADMKASFDYDRLDADAKTSYDIWAQALDRAERRRAFRRHPYIFVRGGAHTGFPQFLINFHRVDTKSDMEAYVARLSAMKVALGQLLTRAQTAAADGIRPPAFAYAQAIDELKRITTGAPFSRGADSALLADAKTKIAALVDDDKISAEEAASLTTAATKALVDDVKPAYDRIAAWLEADRKLASAEPKGASSLPDGANYYATALFLQTTTTMGAEEIHAIGLSEVARIRAQMEEIKAKVGFKGTLQEFFTFMRRDRQFYFPNTDEGRAGYLALAESYLGEMKKKLPEYFGMLPKADLVVKRVEAFREEPGGAQHYFAGTPDGSRPGIFYAHLSDMNAMPRFQLEDVAYHEGVPGHHLQISIARERTGLPQFRTQYGFGAFSEGWGLYAESLGKEMGFFTDPYSDFGRLSGEIWRAIRLVVDTGMHAKGWSEQQAVEYFLANSPQPEGAVRSEIRRYFVTPGQATSYKIGMMAIQRLRDEARTTLGAKFDYRGFHDVVLGGGGVPLPVLESRVRRWVSETQAAGKS